MSRMKVFADGAIRAFRAVGRGVWALILLLLRTAFALVLIFVVLGALFAIVSGGNGVQEVVRLLVQGLHEVALPSLGRFFAGAIETGGEGSLKVTLGAIVVGLWKSMLGDPFEVLLGLLQSLKEAGVTSWEYVLGSVPRDDWISSLFKPLPLAVAPFVLAGLFSGGSQPSEDLCQDSCPHTKAMTESVLLPVYDRVHFDNATIDPESESRFGEKLELGERGVALGPSQKKALAETVQSLDKLACCHQKDITIQVAGFASNASFVGVIREESNRLNVDASNDRALAVYEALKESACKYDRITIEKPPKQTSFCRMEADRNKLLEVPDGEPLGGC